MREIELRGKGLVTLVDDEDYEWLSQWNWNALRATHADTWYVRRTGPRPAQISIRMHRQILEAPPGIVVDHRNGDGLDNQRSNLRLATYAQNGFNRGPGKNNSSGVKGVSWHKRADKWTATINLNGKQLYLGLFDELEDAAQAYRCAAVELQGEFARI